MSAVVLVELNGEMKERERLLIIWRRKQTWWCAIKAATMQATLWW